MGAADIPAAADNLPREEYHLLLGVQPSNMTGFTRVHTIDDVRGGIGGGIRLRSKA